jgi:hypothetical protein
MVSIFSQPPATVVNALRSFAFLLLSFLSPYLPLSFPSSLLPFLAAHSTWHTSQLAADLVVDGEGSLIVAQLGDTDASGKLIRMARRGMTSSVRLRLYCLSLHTLPLQAASVYQFVSINLSIHTMFCPHACHVPNVFGFRTCPLTRSAPLLIPPLHS